MRSDMTLNELLRRQPVQWQGVRLDAPDWSYDSHSLAATVRLLGDRVVLHLMVNAYWEALQFEIPAVERGRGSRGDGVVDTFLDSPDDICDWAEGSDRVGCDISGLNPVPWCFWLPKLHVYARNRK